ncbi:S26 family signal peptidase [Actinomadura fibrosa]|uniref:S26 family signal peptidase n=1 Tax=Actinomadura fibrosa TaxID=111802 RepID=A0ABW2XVS6_9ACTN|nr:S26 family signal peptidase [Actinomadura fibrosa]
MRTGAVTAVAGGLALGSGLGALWIRRNLLVATVNGRSMEPTLHAGDRLLVRRTDRVRPGQIVVVRAPDPPLGSAPPDTGLTPEEEAALPLVPEAAPPPGGRLLVKRAVAVAGDRVPRDGFPALREASEDVVPPGALVVLGDNPSVSWDSREYGFVRPGECVGVAVRRLHA